MELTIRKTFLQTPACASMTGYVVSLEWQLWFWATVSLTLMITTTESLQTKAAHIDWTHFIRLYTPLYLYVLIRFGIVSSASLKLSPSSSRFIRTSSLASRTMIFLKYNFSHGSCNTKYQYWYCPISHSGLPSFSSQILACSMLAGKPSTRKPLDSGCLPIASNSRSVTSSWNDGN